MEDGEGAERGLFPDKDTPLASSGDMHLLPYVTGIRLDVLSKFDCCSRTWGTFFILFFCHFNIIFWRSLMENLSDFIFIINDP